MRYKAILEYDGSDYVGWQTQRGFLSLEGTLTKALEALTQAPAQIFAAGRTDAGVHALGQVCHFDIKKTMHPHVIKDGLNAHLRNTLNREDFGVLSVDLVPDRFHARFSATHRRYLYRILNRRTPPVLRRNRCFHVIQPLDIDAMKQGATYFIGHHDFTSFRGHNCQSPSPFKTLDLFEVTSSGEEITIHIASRSFLHHQVRNMVGSLVLVGLKKWQPEHIKEVLAAKDRTRAGPSAPPFGLYLEHITYPLEALCL